MNTQVKNDFVQTNIIIAEFWGYKLYPADPLWKQLFYWKGMGEHYWIENKDKSIQRLLPTKFRFDFDWNWLIPVIKKITSLNILDAPHNQELIKNHSSFIINIKEKLIYNDINGAYDLVINFINEYNKR